MQSRFARIPSAQSVLIALTAFAGAFVSMHSKADVTSNLQVSATVPVGCTITTTAVTFGNYEPQGTNAGNPADAQGAVNVTCTNGSTTQVILGQGSHADDGSTNGLPLRRMTNGTNFLSYGLFTDSAHAAIWTNESTGGVTHNGTGTPAELTVYGRIPAGQNVPAGNYTDTVQATVVF
ncbi:spore coat U domain-containing protein [Xylophilus sp. GOD-11R]|uniref:Csu type fimbrial protein n=1 Tax=Xylophilus sp. GOD-11R TaxID=3089814 RepID=UPI00298D2D7C|nr:spore coat U domain-containing protein [Xylophilus sp. GOD-11R]WPB59319.1 spore coat U domain-containing protein [Xylophilus sp. GOD-11R]